MTDYQPLETSLNIGRGGGEGASGEVDNGLIQIPPTSLTTETGIRTNVMARKKSQEQMLGTQIDLDQSYLTN